MTSGGGHNLEMQFRGAVPHDAIQGLHHHDANARSLFSNSLITTMWDPTLVTASSKCAPNTSNPNCVNVSHTSFPSATAQRRFFKHASRYTLQQNTSSNERAAYASRNVGRGTRNEGGNVVDGYGSRTRGTRKCHRFIRGMCDIERILTQLGRASSSEGSTASFTLHGT